MRENSWVEQKQKRNNQGKDPRTIEENSQGGDLNTLEANSQAEDPRTRSSRKVASSRKAEGREVEEKEEEKRSKAFRMWEAFRKCEQNARTSKKEWKWQRGIVAHPLSEGQWNRRNFRMMMWESGKHKGWCIPAEGFKGHVATDGSLLGTAGKWESMWLGSGAVGS